MLRAVGVLSQVSSDDVRLTDDAVSEAPLRNCEMTWSDMLRARLAGDDAAPRGRRFRSDDDAADFAGAPLAGRLSEMIYRWIAISLFLFRA